MNSNEFIIYLLMAFISISCLKEEDLNLPFTDFSPKDIGDGWEIADPEMENIDPEALGAVYRDIFRSGDLWSLRSLLVFRNGKLVSEVYLKNANDITTKHLIWSSTKQVMGVLAGIALQKGVIEDINDPISKYLPEEIQSHPDKKDIKVVDLITMRSGIGFKNDGLGGHTDLLLRKKPENSIEFILQIPMTGVPGVTYHYNDGNPHLLSAIIQKRVGKPTDIWANEVLFSRIGMNNYTWVRYKDGITFGAFGIETTPRELAKIAFCVLNEGKWENNQIVDSLWISQMISPMVKRNDGYYMGYYWITDKSRNIQYMEGHGGQYAIVAPDFNIMILMTAIPNTQDDYQITPDEALPIVDRILEAAY